MAMSRSIGLILVHFPTKKGDSINEEIISRAALHWNSAVHRVPSCICADNSQLGAKHGLRRGRIGDVQRRRIQVYSGAHFAGRLGASQCAGPMAAGKRISKPQPNTHSNTHSYANSHAETNCHTNTDSNAFRRQRLCGAVEFHHSLSWWQRGERGKQQLHRAVLESGSKSNHPWQQRPGWYGRSLVLAGLLQWWLTRPHADTNPNSNAKTHSNSYADANPESYSYTKPDSYAKSHAG
jgi:hypothetical protein